MEFRGMNVTITLVGMGLSTLLVAQDLDELNKDEGEVKPEKKK